MLEEFLPHAHVGGEGILGRLLGVELVYAGDLDFCRQFRKNSAELVVFAMRLLGNNGLDDVGGCQGCGEAVGRHLGSDSQVTTQLDHERQGVEVYFVGEAFLLGRLRGRRLQAELLLGEQIRIKHLHDLYPYQDTIDHLSFLVLSDHALAAHNKCKVKEKFRGVQLGLRAPFQAGAMPEPRRCMTAWYSITPAATETFSEPMVPRIGMDTSELHLRNTGAEMPVSSAPMTIAVGRV